MMSSPPVAIPPVDDPTPFAPPTTILLVRHTEVHNPDRVLYGRLPHFRLSDYGRKQAERTAAFLANRPVAAIYSSPLLRARQTADLIARYHPDATRHVSTLLHEVGSGWHGTPVAAFKPGFVVYQERREPDDEALEDVAARMVRFVRRTRRRHPGACVVAVSHGDPISALRVVLGGRALTLASVRGYDSAALGSVTEITYRPGEARPRVSYLVVPWTVANAEYGVRNAESATGAAARR